jgi:hypothetical protein
MSATSATGSSRRLAEAIAKFEFTSLHHPVTQFSDFSENRSKSARVRAICYYAWTRRAAPGEVSEGRQRRRRTGCVPRNERCLRLPGPRPMSASRRCSPTVRKATLAGSISPGWHRRMRGTQSKERPAIRFVPHIHQ